MHKPARRATRQPPPPNRLRELREARGWKPYNVAHLLDERGESVDPSTVRRWETGRSTIHDSVKFTLADLYGVSVPYLMGWDEEAAA